MGRPRVFLGTLEIAGYYANLKKGLDELGVDSILVTFNELPFQYSANEDAPWPTRLAQRIGRGKAAARGVSRVRGWLWLVAELCARVTILIWALPRYDVFVFGFLASFLKLWDLPLLRLLGRPVVCVLHGSEARPQYLNGTTLSDTEGLTIEQCIAVTARARRDVAFVDRHATAVVNHPPTGHFHRRPFVPFWIVGLPFIGTHVPIPPPRDDGRIRIVHAPSRPAQKGSYVFRAIIDRLKAKGHPIDWIEMVNQPNARVLSELAACDFVVDELYSDSTMAGLATEAAYFGKPSVVAGYATPADFGPSPSGSPPPSLYVRPEEVEAAIERMVVDRAQRETLGRAAKDFVDRFWTARGVAERILALARGEIPQESLFDPSKVRYLHGWGLSDAAARDLVRRVLAHGGPAALAVADKPELERALVAFAGTRDS